MALSAASPDSVIMYAAIAVYLSGVVSGMALLELIDTLTSYDPLDRFWHHPGRKR